MGDSQELSCGPAGPRFFYFSVRAERGRAGFRGLRAATEGFAQPKGEFFEPQTDGLSPQHEGVIRAFVDCILKGTPLVADGKEGINGLTLSNAMHLSSWLGCEVTLPLDEELFLQELNKKRASSKKKTGVKELTLDVDGTYGNR